jgi:succinyl-CoA synthetase beta subunit
VNTQPFRIASNVKEAIEGAESLKQSSKLGHTRDVEFVVKAQVLAGGRGKGKFLNSGLQGGVKLVSTPEQVQVIAAQMFGDRLVTAQTPPEGVLVNKVE